MKHPYWTILKWFFIIGFAIVGIKAVLLPVFLAGKVVDTAGQVVNKTLDADNVINNYEWFYDVNAAFDARVGQIEQHEKFMTDEQDAAELRRLRIELGAMQQTCRELATKYNANSEKMNRSIFKGWQLPASLSMERCT